jgi:hypothetical protein
MRKRMPLVWMAYLGLAAPAAFGAVITIAGPQARPTPAVNVERSQQPTISYWQYKQQQSRSRQSGAGRLSSQSFYYGNGLRYRPGTVDRSTFRYRLPEFHMQRFANLRGDTHRGRFDGRSKRYSPSIRYTNSFAFVRRYGFASTIRYGFDRH